MPDVIDFLVLRQQFDDGRDREWTIGQSLLSFPPLLSLSPFLFLSPLLFLSLSFSLSVFFLCGTDGFNCVCVCVCRGPVPLGHR